MLARTAVCLAGDGGRGGGIVVAGEAIPWSGIGGRRDCNLLLIIQRIILLVEGGAHIWSTLCGRLRSIALLGTWHRLDARFVRMALGIGCASLLQRVRHSDGCIDFVTAGDAG